MANLLVQDPIYITVQDYRDTTSNTELESASEDVIKSVIYNAQRILDEYINHYGTSYEASQLNIFPIMNSDGESEVPTDIAIATVYIGDSYYSNKTNSPSGVVRSVTSGPRKVEYFEAGADTSLYIPKIAEDILARYKSDFFYQEV